MSEAVPADMQHEDFPERTATALARFVARSRAVLSTHALDHIEDQERFGDHVIAGMPLDPEISAMAKPAAVLMPVVKRPEGLTIILTERSARLSSHAGQVAFPGGRIDPGETPLDAALREAEEEIALDRALVEPLGFLPPYFSGSGFRVQPLVALVPPDARLEANPSEVGRIFEVPLDHVLDLARYRRGTIFFRGSERLFYILDHPDAYIWGVTAGIMRSLAERY